MGIHCGSGLTGRPPAARTKLRGWSVWPGQWWLERRFREATNNITAPEVVVRTTLQKRVGGYDPQLPHTGDLEMWLRLAANSDVGFLRGVDQAYYRVRHGQNMRTSYDALMDLRQLRLAFEVALDRCGDKVSERPAPVRAGCAASWAGRHSGLLPGHMISGKPSRLPWTS